MKDRIELHPVTLLKLINKDHVYNFTTIKNILLSSDDEDGGGHYQLVIQRDSDQKYFSTNYCDWDIENTDYDCDEDNEVEYFDEYRVDLNCCLHEVFPKTITSVIYE